MGLTFPSDLFPQRVVASAMSEARMAAGALAVFEEAFKAAEIIQGEEEKANIISSIASPMAEAARATKNLTVLEEVHKLAEGLNGSTGSYMETNILQHCKAAIDRYFAERNEAYRRNPRRAGKKIWGKELVKPCFAPSNNCKDPNWR